MKGSMTETPRFELVGIDGMVCCNCLHKGKGKPGICDEYPRCKPLAVIRGGECDRFVEGL